MAKVRIDVRLDDKQLKKLAREFDTNGETVIRAVAFSTEGEAKTRAPVDTSALRNSIYTRTDEGSYEDGRPLNGGLPDLKLPALGKRSKRIVTHVDQSPLPKPKKNEAIVGPSVEYGLYQELGANGMAAQPFLEPAVAKVASSGQFARAVREVLKKYE